MGRISSAQPTGKDLQFLASTLSLLFWLSSLVIQLIVTPDVYAKTAVQSQVHLSQWRGGGSFSSQAIHALNFSLHQDIIEHRSQQKSVRLRFTSKLSILSEFELDQATRSMNVRPEQLSLRPWETMFALTYPKYHIELQAGRLRVHTGFDTRLIDGGSITWTLNHHVYLNLHTGRTVPLPGWGSPTPLSTAALSTQLDQSFLSSFATQPPIFGAGQWSGLNVNFEFSHTLFTLFSSNRTTGGQSVEEQFGWSSKTQIGIFSMSHAAQFNSVLSQWTRGAITLELSPQSWHHTLTMQFQEDRWPLDILWAYFPVDPYRTLRFSNGTTQETWSVTSESRMYQPLSTIEDSINHDREINAPNNRRRFGIHQQLTFAWFPNTQIMPTLLSLINRYHLNLSIDLGLCADRMNVWGQLHTQRKRVTAYIQLGGSITSAACPQNHTVHPAPLLYPWNDRGQLWTSTGLQLKVISGLSIKAQLDLVGDQQDTWLTFASWVKLAEH